MKPRFKASADRALAFFKKLRIPDLPGKPTFAEAGRQWQFELVAELFGARNPETHEQTIREAFLCVAKKNFKSGVGAGLLLTAVHMQEREEDEMSLLSSTKKAARSAFRTMTGMVRATEELADAYKINNTSQQLKHKATGTEILVLALDASATAGSRSSWVLLDELWAMGSDSKAEGALLEAVGGLTSRPEGCIVSLTTQSDEPPAGVFKEKLDYARRVKSGEIDDPSFLPVIYEPPPGFDWRADIEGAIRYANPNLGASTHLDRLLSEYAKVKDDRTGKLQKWCSKYINLEIGTAMRTDNWVAAEFWEAQEIALDLEQLLGRCEVVEVGIDGGGSDDLLGLVVLGREKGTRHKLAWAHAWCEPIALERRKEIAPRLLDFAAAGELTITDAAKRGEEVAAFVAKVRATGLLEHVAVDRYGIGTVLERLEETGAAPGEISGIIQGTAMQDQIKTVENWLSAGELFVAKQSLMRWCISNARIEQRSNGIILSKAASGIAKIDPVMALLDAALPMSKNPPAKTGGELLFFTMGGRDRR